MELPTTHILTTTVTKISTTKFIFAKSADMKTGSPSRHQPIGNKKYVIGSFSTPVGPAGMAVWLNEVSGVDTTKAHMIGVKRYNDSTIWVRDTDEAVHELIRDRDRALEEYHRSQKLYSEHLQEKQHGGR